MFFCEECRVEKEWPVSWCTSHGRCEVCGNTKACHDVSSSNLPRPKPHKSDICENPACRAQEVEGGFVKITDDGAFQHCNCLKCEATWTNHYTISGSASLYVPEEEEIVANGD